jgi:cyclic nucleotide gated channel alpha 3
MISGEVGREMYIVDCGKLQVLSEEAGGEASVLATLTSGAYFGEISLLNVTADTGNRRTASVISVGYTQLLCLSKSDISEVANHVVQITPMPFRYWKIIH